jgi:AbrB family looped-hinge helix DNA binding protein
MIYTSTITQKGQILIPKELRDKLHLKSGDRVSYSIQEEKIYIEPVISVDEAAGMFADKAKGKKPLTKKEMKEIIAKAVVEKFKKKGLL